MTNVIWIAPDVPSLPKLMWLSELGRLTSLPGVAVTAVTGNVKRHDVDLALSQKSDVVVWSGHGRPGGLVLSDESIVEGLWLAVRLGAPDTAPQVVVLAACASQDKNAELSSLTATISRNGVTVIGFPALTDDQAASDFIVEFVGAIGKTTPLQAFDVALEAIAKTTTAKGVFMMNAAAEFSYRIHAELKEIKRGIIEIRDILYSTGSSAAGGRRLEGASSASYRGQEDDQEGDQEEEGAGTARHIRGIGLKDPLTDPSQESGPVEDGVE